VNIVVNGAPRELPPETGLVQLLEMLGLRPEATVVEHNGNVLERSTYGGVTLAEGDVLELVRFVGGG
jgi:thiamine biosynthesis protein ThiS